MGFTSKVKKHAVPCACLPLYSAGCPGNNKTGKVSSHLLSGAAVCTFLLTLLPVTEPWKACTKLKDLDQPSEAPCIQVALPHASVRALSPGTWAVCFGAGLPILSTF